MQAARTYRLSDATFEEDTQAMSIVFKPGMTPEQIAALGKKVRTSKRKRAIRKVPDVRQFCGVITLKEDPIVIQQGMRDEWR